MVEGRGHVVRQAALKQGAELPLQVVVGPVDQDIIAVLLGHVGHQRVRHADGLVVVQRPVFALDQIHKIAVPAVLCLAQTAVKAAKAVHDLRGQLIPVIVPSCGIVALTDDQHPVRPVQHGIHRAGAALYIGAQRVQAVGPGPEPRSRDAAPAEHGKNHRCSAQRKAAQPLPRAVCQQAKHGQHPCLIVGGKITVVILEHQPLKVGKVVAVEDQGEQIQRRKAERKPKVRRKHPAAGRAFFRSQPRGGGNHGDGSNGHGTAAQQADAPGEERAAHGGHDLGKFLGTADAQQLLDAAHEDRAVAQPLAANAGGSVCRGGDGCRIAAPA